MSKAFETLALAGNLMAMACDQFRELTWELSEEQLEKVKPDIVEFAKSLTETTLAFNKIKAKLAETEDEKERVPDTEGFEELMAKKLARLEKLSRGEKVDKPVEWPEEIDTEK